MLATGVFYVILYVSRVGPFLDDHFDTVLRWLQLRLGPKPRYYLAEERTGGQFQDDIKRSIKSSDRMYCLLISAHTLVYEDEKFILDALQSLPNNKLRKKDLKILLLSRETEVWVTRSNLLVANRLSNDGLNLDAYISRCAEAELVLKQCHAKIAHYNSDPRWRLYLFDNRVYVSRYAAPPEGFVEGHKNHLAAFDRGHPMFEWMFSVFRKQAPNDWELKL